MSDPYASRPAVHEQTVDGFGAVRVLPLDPAADAPLLHRWVSEERAVFWGMNGLTEQQVHEIYAHMDTLDTHHAYLVVKDGDPAALLQTYEPEADRVGECYPVEPGDIGMHLLLAPARPGGTRSGWTGGSRPSSPRTSCWCWTGGGSSSTRTSPTRRRSPGSSGRASPPDPGWCSRRSTCRTCTCRRSEHNSRSSPGR
ncbi:hypothetical protein SALBM217S_09292 [Streptomyces griseoloalbus]